MISGGTRGSALVALGGICIATASTRQHQGHLEALLYAVPHLPTLKPVPNRLEKHGSPHG